MSIIFLIMLFVIGSCLGSFLCCQARRMKYKSECKTKIAKKKQSLGSRSICLNCHCQLRWYDNVPIISWLLLRGKCRRCRHRIGYAEILSELGLGLSFLGLGTTFNINAPSALDCVGFFILLVFMCLVGFLAIYDGLYGELPTVCLILAIVVAVIYLAIQEIIMVATLPFSAMLVLNPLISVLILGGLYLFLYLVSKGRWVGDGDWLLGTAIALVLFYPWLSINALFVANLSACLVMLPLLKKRQTHQIHLGPFLVIGFVVVYSVSGLLLGLIN